MTASASHLAETQVWEMAPSLRGLRRRAGTRPHLDAKWPCLQDAETASPVLIDALAAHAGALPGSTVCEAPFQTPGQGFALDEDLARGQPEAFVSEPVWLILRDDGALHLGLRPEWAQRLLTLGWATVHPFARYMAGAVPPQSLIVFAPRNEEELIAARSIMEAAYGYAVGRIGDVILPDTRW